MPKPATTALGEVHRLGGPGFSDLERGWRHRRRRVVPRELDPYALDRLEPERARLGLQRLCPPTRSDLHIAVLQAGPAEAFGGGLQRPALGVAGQAAADQAIELVVVDALADRQQGPIEFGRLQSDGLGEGRRGGGAVVAPGVDLDAFQIVGRRSAQRSPCTSAKASMAPTRRDAGCIEARFAIEALRIDVGAEDHVPQWQVAEIAIVHAALVMQAMRLGALEEEAEPARRGDIEMLDHRGDRVDVTDQRRRARIDAEHEGGRA